jgi:hypothetical protein
MSAIKVFIVVYTHKCNKVLDYKTNYNLPFVFLAVKYQDKEQIEFVLEQAAVFNIWTLEVGINRVIVETV